MLRPALLLLHVDREHLAVSEQVAERGEIERAAAERGTGLDDQVRPELVEQLLIDPQVERALVGAHPEPARVGAGLAEKRAFVVGLGEPLDDVAVEPAPEERPVDEAAEHIGLVPNQIHERLRGRHGGELTRGRRRGRRAAARRSPGAIGRAAEPDLPVPSRRIAGVPSKPVAPPPVRVAKEPVRRPPTDLRAGKPYLLTSAPLRNLVRRAAAIATLATLDAAGLSLGLYAALVVRSLVFGDEILWGLLWEAGPAEWLPFLIPITLLVFWQAGLYATRERRAGAGRVASSLVLVAAITLAFGWGTGYDFTTSGLIPTACVTYSARDREPASGLRVVHARAAAGPPRAAARPPDRGRRRALVSVSGPRRSSRRARVRVRRLVLTAARRFDRRRASSARARTS